MSELVERYIHQVGRYLPPKERTEIEAELRSQLEDQLDDRFPGVPTEEDVASVLKEWGHPYQIARSYREEQYLIGPDIYPVMMRALRYGWFTVPAIVLFLNVFAELGASQVLTFTGLVLQPLLASLIAVFSFSALVVLVFAIIQHLGIIRKESAELFNPLDLPQADNPALVDRFEAAFGITLGSIIMLVLLFWLQVGGLTLRFNLSNPGDVIPVSAFWIVFLIAVILGILITNLLALWRNRWSFGLFLFETALEMIGVFGMYFVLYRPVFELAVLDNPNLINVPFISSAPEIIAVLSAILPLFSNSSKLIRLWNHISGDTAPLSIGVNSR